VVSNSAQLGRISWPAAISIVTLIAALLIAFIFYRTETWPMRAAHGSVAETERVARELRNAFTDVAHLQPRISINNRVYLEQTTQTGELSLISRRVEVEHEFENSWAGSSKRLKLHGTFNVRAGFDLRQNVSIDVRPDAIVIQLPHAQILGVEQEAVEVLELENGYWNRISSSDVQGELATLPQLARARAEQASLPAEAEQALRQQIEARVHVSQPIRLSFGPVAPSQ
jgi:hypothetical protein